MSHDLNARIHAATIWLMTGSFKEAAQVTGIPERTIRHWADQPWWDSVLEEARSYKDKELDSMWTRALHAVGEQLTDRIVNGDYQMKRNGDIVRVPLKAGQLAVIGSIATDKRAEIRKKNPRVASENVKEKPLSLDELSSSLETDNAIQGQG